MQGDFEYRLNPAYCIYKGVAIEEQNGSEISFVISDKKIRKTIKKSFYDFVENVRSLSECPPEYSKKPNVKFKISNRENIEKIVSGNINDVYSKEQLEIFERICKETEGLVVAATESESENYGALLHFQMEVRKNDCYVIKQWSVENLEDIIKYLEEKKLVFVEMKKSTVADVISELKKVDYFSDEVLLQKLKGIIVQETHEYLEKEDLLAEIAIFKKKLPEKAFEKMSEEEKDNCFEHFTNFGTVLQSGRKRLFEKQNKKLGKAVSLAAVFCLSVFTSFVGCKKTSFSELPDKYDDLEKMNSRIKKEFIDTCFGSGFSSLNEWQKENRKEWNLDYIGWSPVEAFLVDNSECKAVYPYYYGCWAKNNKLGDVFCRSRVKSEELAKIKKELKNITVDEILPPYRISGELDYSDLSISFKYWFFNNYSKNIRSFTIVFYLFDEDGNPPAEIRNNIVLDENTFVEKYSNISRRIPLNSFFESIPEEEYSLEYLYVSKIVFTDGTVWNDPFGMKYLN